VNLSPLKPILSARTNRRPESHYICDALSERYKDFQRRDLQARREIMDIGRLVSNCRNGKLLLMRHVESGRLMFVNRDSRYVSDNKTVGGTFQFYSDKLLSEWLASRPARNPVCPSTDDRVEEFISAVGIVQDHYDLKLFTDSYETDECLSAQDYGIYISRFRYEAGTNFGIRNVLEDKEVTFSKGYGKCRMCGYEGNGEDDQCPKCGELMENRKPQKEVLSRASGSEIIPGGDIVGELLLYPATNYDIRFRPEESPYFIYEQKCSNNLITSLVGELELTGEIDNYGLQSIDQIARQGGNVAGYGKDIQRGEYNLDRNESIVSEMWIKPEVYSDILIKGDEETVGGVDLPQGESLANIFPDGLVAIGINGFKHLIGLYAEKTSDHIVSGYYHKQSFSGLGKGVSDAVDIQKEMNDLHSQTMAYIKAHSTPAWYYNQDLITEEQAGNIGKPKKVIPVDMKLAPEGMRDINQAVAPIVPSNPASSVFQYGQQLENFLQIAFQVTNFSDGLPGLNNSTAYGVEQGKQLAQSMLVPQHRNKADHRKRADKVIFNLFRKYCNVAKFFATKDKNGITKGKYIVGTSLPDVEIEYEIIPDSEVPKTGMTKMLALDRLFAQTGGLVGLQQAVATDPELTGAVVQGYGLNDLPIAKINDIARVCRRRIEQAKKELQKERQIQEVLAPIGIPINNTNTAQNIVAKLVPPISPGETYHLQKVDWLSQLMDADELMLEDVDLRNIVSTMIIEHVKNETLRNASFQQAQNIQAILGGLPNLMLQQGMQNQQMSTQQQMQDEQNQQNMANQQMQGEVDWQRELENRQMDREDKETEFANQAVMQNANNQHQLALAKQKV
jgi:hypothetical protein